MVHWWVSTDTNGGRVEMIPVVRELRTDGERRLVARATDAGVLGSSSVPVPDVTEGRLYGRSSRDAVAWAWLALDMASCAEAGPVRLRQRLKEACA